MKKDEFENYVKQRDKVSEGAILIYTDEEENIHYLHGGDAWIEPEFRDVEVGETYTPPKMNIEDYADKMVEEMAQGVDVLGEGENVNTSSKQKGYSTAIVLAILSAITSAGIIILGTFLTR